MVDHNLIEKHGHFEAAQRWCQAEVELGLSTATVDTFLGLVVDDVPNVASRSTGTEFVYFGQDVVIQNRFLYPWPPAQSLAVFGSEKSFVFSAALFPEICKQRQTLNQVIECAKALELFNIANRLSELRDLPLEADEVQVHPESAFNFVQYSVLRGKGNALPLITSTPTGELDVTWKGPTKQKVTMRFFAKGVVWVAYKLGDSSGSLEADFDDLLKPNFHFKIPQWA